MKYVKGFCKKNKIDIIDFTYDSVLVKNQKYFGDLYHLNEEGANLFSD